MVKYTEEEILDRFKGCFIGGAVGDALGAPIEFMSMEQIKQTFGECGLTDYAPSYGRKGAITDDTQMLLFTAEGLILSGIRQEYAAKKYAVVAVYHALLRWLYTQDTHRQHQLIKEFGSCSIVDGVLTGYEELFSLRAPGNTCLAALRSGKMGTMEKPINDSKGCGGVMRVAPVGLAYSDSEKAFRIGAETAAITHGHPSGYLASGFLSALLSRILSGESLMVAIDDTIRILKKYPRQEECLNAVLKALDQSEKKKKTPWAIECLGQGWVAEEALSIGLYCALVAGNDFESGALLSVNHSGDSDSTGSITGNIIGTLYGTSIIPDPWVASLELKEVIEEVAVDLFQQIKPG